MTVKEPGPGTLRTLAFVLIGVGLFLLMVWLGRVWLRDARHEVVVQLAVTDDRAMAFVNCNPVGEVSPQDRYNRFDLGWLRPDDRISIALGNVGQKDASLTGSIEINGTLIPIRYGSPTTPGVPARENGRPFVLERTYLADGDSIGSAGCHQPRFVSLLVGEYLFLDDERVGSGRQMDFSPDREMDRLDQAGALAFWVLVGGGLLVGVALTFLVLIPRALDSPVETLGTIAFVGGLAGAVALFGVENCAVVLGLALYAWLPLWLLRRSARWAASSAGSGSR